MADMDLKAFRRFVLQLEIANGILVAVALVVTHLTMGFGPLLMGALVGGGIGVLNLRGMSWLVGRVIHAGEKSRGFYMGVFSVKLALLAGVSALALATLPIDPLGFMIGFSSLVLAVVVMTIKRGLDPAPNATPSKGGQL